MSERQCWMSRFKTPLFFCAWPLAAFFIFRQFSDEIRALLRRIKNAKYKGVEIDFEKELLETKNEADSAGVTIDYSQSEFPDDSIKNIDAAPEWIFIKSWQEIENILLSYYTNVSGLKSERIDVHKVLRFLEDRSLINANMAMLIQKLHYKKLDSSQFRLQYHSRRSSRVLGIAKSVKDRLKQKLD